MQCLLGLFPTVSPKKKKTCFVNVVIREMEQEKWKTHLDESRVLQITAVNAAFEAASYVHKGSVSSDTKSKSY